MPHFVSGLLSQPAQIYTKELSVSESVRSCDFACQLMNESVIARREGEEFHAVTL